MKGDVHPHGWFADTEHPTWVGSTGDAHHLDQRIEGELIGAAFIGDDGIDSRVGMRVDESWSAPAG